MSNPVLTYLTAGWLSGSTQMAATVISRTRMDLYCISHISYVMLPLYLL